MASNSDSAFVSDQLAEGQIYTRSQLRGLFNVQGVTLDASVFRPSGFNSVWLFVTAQQSSATVGPTQLVQGNTLVWPCLLDSQAAQLVITHELRGLELLVFYRESDEHFSGAGFTYLGRFEYLSHTGERSIVFHLARSGSVPSIHEVQSNLDKQPGFSPTTVRDGREWVLATIVRRRGQASFRASLLAAYSSTCAVTGCKVEAILEAAHIIPYLGPTTNHVQNGLLLRADIHTLFDLQLLAINPESFTTQLAPELIESEYAMYRGKRIRLPAQLEYQPSRDALRAHRMRCGF